ncbi:MAG TPA: efflux RND transporter permease subunit [Acidobacteriota bacterium]|nr:efflux RND transporter permease subunit [Acidobacteriota bacterium]
MAKKLREESLLPKFSVTRPVTVIVIFVALLVVGYIAYTKIPLEMLPSGFTVPFMGVFVSYPNATPEEIEQQITRPIEQILGTVRNLKRTTASIGRDYTWIGIQLQQGTDMDLAYAEVRDRMDRVMSEVPEDVERIVVRRFDINDDAEMYISLLIHKDIPDLYYFLNHNLGKQLMRIDGIANVEFEGVQEKNFEILLQMDKISAHRINLGELVQTLRNSNFSIPSGFVREGDKRFYIRGMGRFRSIDEIKKLEIRPGVLVEDIATISFDVPKQESISRMNSQDGVWIVINKKSGANSVDLHFKVMEALDKEFTSNPSLAGVERGFAFTQGDLILNALTDLQETAFWAAIFAVLVLFFFLRHVRMTLVITLAIPISLLATLVIMYFTGETLNLLTLMGLMVSVGLVVDNSVVVVENIFRHRKAGDDPKRSAIRGASEVGLAVVMATLTTVVVFLPMILMGGDQMMSFFMGRIGFPVVFALLSSLFVALIFIPVTTTLFKDKGKIGSSKLIDWVRDRYVDSLRWAVAHRVETIILAFFILFGILTYTSDLGYQDDMQGSLNTPIRLRLDKRYSDLTGYPSQVADKIEKWIVNHKEGLGDYVAFNTNISSEWVRVNLFYDSGKSSTPLLEKPVLWVKNVLFMNDMNKNPQMERQDYIRKNLMDDIGMLPGEAELYVGWGHNANQSERGQIQLVLEGRDYSELRRWGERVRLELSELPDVLNVETDIESGRDELAVSINRERARNANVELAWAVATISNALRGAQLPKFQEKDREIRVMVRLREEDRKNVEEFKNLRIPTMDGREVPLSSIASFEHTRGPSNISHWNKKPNYDITITGKSDRIDQLAMTVSNAMHNLGNGDGYSYSFGERFQRMQEDQDSFLFAMLMAVVFVFLLMGVLFESFALPLTIICTIPFAFAGSQLLLKIYGQPANLFAFIGIVIIIGVVVNNGIVLIDLINRQRRKGMDRQQAISLAGYYRFRPILMTAGTTIFSLIPMAFGDANLINMPYNPLGMAMIGGLALNSLLSLLLVPVFYTLFDDLKRIWQWMVSILFGRKTEAPEEALGGADS